MPKIVECRPGDETNQLFEEVLVKIYPAASLRFRPKESINLVYLQSCIIATAEDGAVGRLCVYSNPFIDVDGEACLLIGNFECVNDSSVCQALIAYVEEMARNMGAIYIIGPINGSTWDDYRFPLTDCIDPYLSDSSQPVYYARMFEENGFSIMHRYYTSVAANDGSKKLQRQELEYLKDYGIKIRSIDLNKYEAELRLVYKLCIESFKNNILYSPIEESYFVEKYNALKALLDPAFILLAETDEDLVGLYFCFPDVYAKRLVIKTIAKHPECNVKGLMDIMGKMIYEQAYNKGYGRIVHAYMHEHNRSRTISRNFYGEVTREYALFIKPLQQ